MNNFTTAGVIRRSKILIVLMASLFGLMTLINNFTDYAAYSDYIGRIISMSDTVGNDSRRYRAVSSTIFHHRFYWAIITLEIIFTFSFLVGTYQLYRKLSAPAVNSTKPKSSPSSVSAPHFSFTRLYT
nr:MULTISPECIES: DUF2165 family protein [unclassified Pseudomonas]